MQPNWPVSELHNFLHQEQPEVSTFKLIHYLPASPGFSLKPAAERGHGGDGITVFEHRPQLQLFARARLTWEISQQQAELAEKRAAKAGCDGPAFNFCLVENSEVRYRILRAGHGGFWWRGTGGLQDGAFGAFGAPQRPRSASKLEMAW